MQQAPRICTLSDQGLDWFTRYTLAIGGGNAGAFEALLHPEAAFQINNHMPIYGAHTIAQAMARYRGTVEDMRYEVLNIYGSDMHFAAELLHHYVRKDGGRVTVPAGIFIDRDASSGGLISARAHFDVTPVFE